MIIRYFLSLLLTINIINTVGSQNARSYDTNDWIPITPSSLQQQQEQTINNNKKATGRVLNLDSPNQKFYDEAYLRKQQQENIKRPLHAPIRAEHPYVFESVPPPQYLRQQQQPQHLSEQYLRQQQQQQQQRHLSEQLLAPPPIKNGQNYYNNNYLQQQQQQQQLEHNIPFNRSYYQSLNPGAINQEILGAIQNNHETTTTTTTARSQDKESVQLLYVPLENLKLQQPQQHQLYQQQQQLRKDKQIINNNPKLVANIQDDFVRQAYAAHKLQQQLQQNQPIILHTTTPFTTTTTTTTTTPKPRKRKPHQPPLAVFMEKPGPAEIKDVLEVLKNAKSIAVQDTITPNSPQVFVGPSNLNSPEGYSKFPLPYLSTIEGNRIERKVDELPFFVAPLSYKTPDGYSKIPLPSPHVGSVVVATKDADLHEKHPIIRQSPIIPNQIKEDFDIKNPFGQQQQQYEFNQDQFEPTYQVPVNDNHHHHYDSTSSKEFLAGGYQVNPEKDYVGDTVGHFQPTVNTNFDFISNYQTTPRNQQQTFIHNFQSTVKPQTPADVFGIIDQQQQQQPIRHFPPSSTTTTTSTTTTEKQQLVPLYTNEPQTLRLANHNDIYQQRQQPIIANHDDVYQQQQQQPIINTLRTTTPQYQPINQYELEQINNQFIVPPTTTEQRYEAPTTSRIQVRTRARTRSRPTTTTTRATTRAPSHVSSEIDNYTVLEEFSIQPKTTTTKYKTEIETIPANVYKLNSGEKLEPVYIQQQQQQHDEIPKQHVLNQDALDHQILQRPVVQQDQQHDSPLVYNRGQQIHQLEQEIFPQLYQQQHEQHQQQPQYEEQHPFFPSLINNLQDQAVKPLLNPTLLVPTTEKLSTTTTELYIPTTTSSTTTTTTEAPQTTTTTRRSRGRQRGNTIARYNSASTSTSTPRRRRPIQPRTTTERSETVSTDYESTRRTVNTRQRFRTRGRTPTPTTSTTTTTQRSVDDDLNINRFKQPVLESGFQASTSLRHQNQPQVEEQRIIEISPVDHNNNNNNKDYHQVYNVDSRVNQQPETVDIVTAPPSRFIQVNANIQSGGVIHNNKNDESSTSISTKSPIRTRKPRIKLRIPSSTSARTPTTINDDDDDSNRDNESYGFIRSPHFNINKPAALIHTTTEQPVYSSTYRRIEQQEEDRTERHDTINPNNIRFVGQIRPKYQQQQETTTSRSITTTTKRNSRGRIRGKSHFKLPENLHKKRDDDEDVEGGNYPGNYKKQETQIQTERSAFQITVDPYESGDGEVVDQEPHGSIFRPKWVDASILPPLNDIPSNEIKNFPITAATTTTEQEEEEEEATTTIPTTTDVAITTTPTARAKSRRRGVWKLVKQRPVDHFETAESQNYQSVLNTFDDIVKENNNNKAQTTESSILDTLYNMFGLVNKDNNNNNNNNVTNDEIVTTTVLPTFPDEYTTNTPQDELLVSTTEENNIETTTIVEKVSNIIKTSTSTEVSHETEICYKGRCVKSKDKL